MTEATQPDSIFTPPDTGETPAWTLLVPLALLASVTMVIAATTAWTPVDRTNLFVLSVAAMGTAVAGVVLWQAAAGSRGALIAMLLVAAVLPCLNFRDREIGSIGLDPQNAAKLAVWAATGLVAAARWRSWTPRLRDPATRALWLYILVAAPTILVSPIPAYSMASLLGLAATLAFAAAIVAELPERTVAHALLFAVGAYAGLGLVAAVVAPEWSLMAPGPGEGMSRLRGLASHPNMLAKDLAGLGGAAVVLGLRSGASRRLMVVVGIVACLALTIAASRSVALAGAACVAFWWWRWSGHRGLALLVVSGLGGLWLLADATGLTPSAAVLSSAVSRTGDGADIVTLTGRTDLWDYVLAQIGRYPLVGYGFNAAEVVIEPGWWGQHEAGIGAHDMLLQSLLTTGVLGTLPFLAFLWIAATRAWRDRGCACRFVPIFLIVLGLTEVEFATHPVALTLALFLLVAVDSGQSATIAEARTGEAPPRSPRAPLLPNLASTSSPRCAPETGERETMP